MVIKNHLYLSLVSLLASYLFFSGLVFAQELIVLNERGKPTRDVLELLGDMKSGDFGRSIYAVNDASAFHSELVNGPTDGTKARLIDFTGDSCVTPDNCFSLLFYKSYHGYLDLSRYSALVFDVKVETFPSRPIGIRIGSYPTRAEIDITDRLPLAGEGWKTIQLTLKEFNDNLYENFSSVYTEDVFSIGTTGKARLLLANIRWVE